VTSGYKIFKNLMIINGMTQPYVLIILDCLHRVILIASSYFTGKEVARIYSHLFLNALALLSSDYMSRSSNIQRHSFPCLSKRHIKLCCHYDTQPATTLDHYYYEHITFALQGQILDHHS